MSSELGKSLNSKSVEDGGYGYLKFSVKNKNQKDTNYRIYIIKNDDTNFIDGSYINFYLSDYDDVPITGYENKVFKYSDLYALNDKPNARLIYNGTLGKNEEEYFVLRSWLSDDYKIQDEEELFSYDVFIESK